MKINLSIDMDDLFEEAQELVRETAEIDADTFGAEVRAYESFSLKDAIKDRIISEAVRDVDRSAINDAIKKLSLDEKNLSRGFDKLAEENIKNSLRNKVDQWIETGIIKNSSGTETTFSNHVEKEIKKTIDALNNKYNSNSIDSTILMIVEKKVGYILDGYEAQIKKEVDAVAGSIIQQKVSEMMTLTFTNLMKVNGMALNDKG